MSNHKHTSSKVIAIKGFSEIHPHRSDEKGNTKSEHQAASSLEINRLQQQISDLTSQKEQILADLNETIEQEKEAWKQEKEKERLNVKEQGYQEGYEAGAIQAETDWQQELKKVNKLADQAKEDYFRTIEKHEEAIIQLAMMSAEKILHRELEKDESSFTTMIQEAIKDLENYPYIHLYIHPNEYEHVLNLKAELEQAAGTGDVISIYADPELSPYSCVIKHPDGQIDVSIDVQLRQIKNALAEKVMNSS